MYQENLWGASIKGSRDKLGPMGIDKMFCWNYFWLGMFKDVSTYVNVV